MKILASLDVADGLQSWRIPSISTDLHECCLLGREGDFPFLVKTDLKQIRDEPTASSSAMSCIV